MFSWSLVPPHSHGRFVLWCGVWLGGVPQGFSLGFRGHLIASVSHFVDLHVLEQCSRTGWTLDSLSRTSCDCHIPTVQVQVSVWLT